MKDFILDTKLLLGAVLIWGLSCVSLIAHAESPLLLLAQSVDLCVLAGLTFRAWKRVLRLR